MQISRRNCSEGIRPEPRHSRSISRGTGQQPNSARKEFIYFDDDGDIVAMRYENWKIVFEEQRAQGTLRIWAEPFTKLRVPKIYNLRSDPYERADVTSNTYYDWMMSDGAASIIAGPAVVAPFLATFQGVPAEPAAVELQYRSAR